MEIKTNSADWVEIPGYGACFHIDEVGVFIGDDDYRVTDAYNARRDPSDRNKLVLGHLINIPQKSDFRLRHEPGVYLRFKEESMEGRMLELRIVHHKGCLMVHCVPIN